MVVFVVWRSEQTALIVGVLALTHMGCENNIEICSVMHLLDAFYPTNHPAHSSLCLAFVVVQSLFWFELFCFVFCFVFLCCLFCGFPHGGFRWHPAL